MFASYKQRQQYPAYFTHSDKRLLRDGPLESVTLATFEESQNKRSRRKGTKKRDLTKRTTKQKEKKTTKKKPPQKRKASSAAESKAVKAKVKKPSKAKKGFKRPKIPDSF